jgi:DNA-binding beta-propeller fold protein YncE
VSNWTRQGGPSTFVKTTVDLRSSPSASAGWLWPAVITVIVIVAATAFPLAQARRAVQAPHFEVDPFWPKPLPNHFVVGSVVGVSVDERDHVWVIHRASALSERERAAELKTPTGECCVTAPPVLEFDGAGFLLNAWGGPGPGYEWPQNAHGITVDRRGNVWIGGNGDADSHILKFTRAGKFVAQFGKAGARRVRSDSKGEAAWAGNSADRESFGRVAKVFLDPSANEAYIADGYLNKRVAVIDADTGAMKRFWGAYGMRPDDTDSGPYKPEAPRPKQFRSPVHCAVMSNDGLVYVCDRTADRIQVFHRDGTFVREVSIAPKTLDGGSASDIAFSLDPAQTYMYVADLQNSKVRILNRESLQELTNFGAGGRQPGQFYGVHSIATDSRGNIYTTETYEGKRVQKFVYRGVRPVTKREQGVVWPR